MNDDYIEFGDACVNKRKILIVEERKGKGDECWVSIYIGDENTPCAQYLSEYFDNEEERGLRAEEMRKVMREFCKKPSEDKQDPSEDKDFPSKTESRDFTSFPEVYTDETKTIQMSMNAWIEVLHALKRPSEGRKILRNALFGRECD